MPLKLSPAASPRPPPHPPRRAALLAALAAAQPVNRFVADNLLVLRSGDGTAAFSGGTSTSAPVFLQEIVATDDGTGAVFGTVAQTVAVAAPTGGKCALDNLYWRDAFGTTRSADGRFVSVLCHNVNPGAAWPGNAITTSKTLARVAADGTVDTSTTAVNMFQNSKCVAVTGGRELAGSGRGGGGGGHDVDASCAHTTRTWR